MRLFNKRKLLTKSIRAALVKQAPLYRTGPETKVRVCARFFNPIGSETWYALLMENKFNGKRNDDLVYCIVPLFDDNTKCEAGDVSIAWLESMGIERDINFNNRKYTMQDIYDGKRP